MPGELSRRAEPPGISRWDITRGHHWDGESFPETAPGGSSHHRT
ncbi:hypothetical protein HMPREF0578_1006 [Mobiluncus mulieris 28-1]|nr:hypothetical protein HMPREF0578_1006 [Mobiluncus mulieris 28-1]